MHIIGAKIIHIIWKTRIIEFKYEQNQQNSEIIPIK